MQGLNPTDYGWTERDGLLLPVWFEDQAVPDTLFTAADVDGDDEVETEDHGGDGDGSDDTIITEGHHDDMEGDDSNISDDEPWSEGSGSDDDDQDEN